MAMTTVKGGPRDGDLIFCPCVGECECTTFGHGAPDGNHILDGYVEWLMYRREGDCWVPDSIRRQTMVVTGLCPRCSRPMPDDTIYCLNCGAEMDVSMEWDTGGG